MKIHSLMTCVLSVLVVGGCDVGTLVDPGNSIATGEVVGKAPKMVPMKVEATFEADLTADPPVLDCGYGEVFFHRFNGEGVISHLGAMTIVIESDECWIDLGDGTLNVKGRAVQTAANGDMLIGTWGGKMYGPGPGGGPNLWDFYAHGMDHGVEYSDGTGRFDGAYGFAEGSGTFDPTTMSGTYWLEGVLSSVGSLK